MSVNDVDDLTKILGRVNISSVSFAGKELKLNTEKDAEEVANAITSCQNMEKLNLEGNTVGVEAARVIGNALSSKPEFKIAEWNNMFSGRMKTEIPKALEYLGDGIIAAGARLTTLILSDNAFGPVGLAGLEKFIRSPSCHSLNVLQLNNNGLGIQGAKLLSNALLDAIESSKKLGKPMALKVFVAGRNRLENDGAKLLARVFKEMKTLEEISMPMNGIYHQGLSVLTGALIDNPNLRVIDLNDNTIGGQKGAVHVANMLPHLKHLRKLNLGDCLLKTSGAVVLAEALSRGNNKELEELYMDSNEIKASAGLKLVKALLSSATENAGSANLSLRVLDLNGNQFGEEGIKQMQSLLGDQSDILRVEDDEGEDDDDEENSGGEEEEEEEEEEAEEEEESGDEKDESQTEKKDEEKPLKKKEVAPANMSVEQFLGSPIPSSFVSLGKERKTVLLDRIKMGQPKSEGSDEDKEKYLEDALEIVMKVSSLAGENQLGHATSKNDSSCEVLSCTTALYEELFRWAIESDKVSVLTNCLLVHMGLIKSEDKKRKGTKWNLDGIMASLEKALRLPNFPRSTKDALECFLGKFNPVVPSHQKSKHKLMTVFYSI
ncbi:ran GTPase-activating protein 1 isoform X2 [Ischnura elegans]|uniref:ran GTPase-activating protein 1 isoform X2 n=1 Tax=Ischnura elegans TaxID=197161 RepID=UPI001ED89486|nr:ran GTPase-activating protein 1 isoform X2 [Ischnura elegans]